MSDNTFVNPETEQGSTFGTPDDHETAGAPSDKTLICATNDCSQQNRQVAVHTDTVLPIYCGGCGNVLHCEHDWQTLNTTAGTLANPIQVVQETCAVCLTQQPPVTTPLPPIDISALPVSVIAAMLNSPTL